MTIHHSPFTIHHSPFTIFLLCIVLGLLLAAPQHAQAQEAEPGDGIPWWTVDTGGGVSRGGGYQLTATMGQPDATVLASTAAAYQWHGGFWYARLAEDFQLWMPVIVRQLLHNPQTPADINTLWMPVVIDSHLDPNGDIDNVSAIVH